jgi:ribosomal protein S18 acetylase RimI-like enzyme
MNATDEVRLRPAMKSDGPALSRLDEQVWSPQSTPAPPSQPGYEFFRSGRSPSQFLVATLGGGVAGYVGWAPPTPLPSSEHVMQIEGFAVAVEAQRRGIGRLLLEAACRTLAEQGISKIGLRVLAANGPALALYQSCGFEQEGVLRGEFLLEGQLVDDLLMARWLT